MDSKAISLTMVYHQYQPNTWSYDVHKIYSIQRLRAWWIVLLTWFFVVNSQRFCARFITSGVSTNDHLLRVFLTHFTILVVMHSRKQKKTHRFGMMWLLNPIFGLMVLTMFSFSKIEEEIKMGRFTTQDLKHLEIATDVLNRLRYLGLVARGLSQYLSYICSIESEIDLKKGNCLFTVKLESIIPVRLDIWIFQLFVASLHDW